MLKLKCTKFGFRWGSAPPHWGAYSTPPDPIAVFKGPTSKGREGKGERRRSEGEGREGKERVGEWRGREGRVASQLGSLDPPVNAVIRQKVTTK